MASAQCPLGGDYGSAKFNSNIIGIGRREVTSHIVEPFWEDLHDYAVILDVGSPTREALLRSQDVHDAVSHSQ